MLIYVDVKDAFNIDTWTNELRSYIIKYTQNAAFLLLIYTLV